MVHERFPPFLMVERIADLPEPFCVSYQITCANCGATCWMAEGVKVGPPAKILCRECAYETISKVLGL